MTTEPTNPFSVTRAASINPRGGNRQVLIRLGLSLGLGLAVPGGWAADVAYFTILKTQFLVQTNNTAPVAAASNAFAFTAAVVAGSNGWVTGATVTPAGKPTRTLVSDSTGIILGYNFGTNNSLFTFSYATNSQADVDALFPNGSLFSPVNYSMVMQTLHDSTKTASLNFATAAFLGFPSSPQVSNLAAGQSIDQTTDFTLHWTITGGSTLQVLQMIVSDAASNLVFSSPAPLTTGALNGTSNQIVIPANTLPAGSVLQGHLVIAQPGPPNTNDYLGALGLPALVKDNAFSLHTRSAPAAPHLALLAPQGGQFRLRLDGETNRTYQIQAAPDLKAWANVFTSNSASGTFDFVDPQAMAGPGRFYRAKVGL